MPPDLFLQVPRSQTAVVEEAGAVGKPLVASSMEALEVVARRKQSSLVVGCMVEEGELDQRSRRSRTEKALSAGLAQALELASLELAASLELELEQEQEQEQEQGVPVLTRAEQAGVLALRVKTAVVPQLGH